MSGTNTGLAAPADLLETMRRVGAIVPPEEFVQGVIGAFREATHVPEHVIRARFRETRAYRDFVTLASGVPLPRGASLLALGCETGYAARSSGYVLELLQEVYRDADVAQMDQLDVSPALLAQWGSVAADRGQYDLVATHSLLHYIFDLRPICSLISALVSPGGRYLMANEPSRRFWENEECVAARTSVDASDRRTKVFSKYLDPWRYWNKLLRIVERDVSEDSLSRINAMLQTRFGLQESLSMREIIKITDPHRPDRHPGTFRMGEEGLDWMELASTHFWELRLEAVRTSGYVRQDNPDHVPEKWRSLDDRLARLYPHDGHIFTVLWSKPEK